jgi:hypothetical protein
MGFSVFQTSFFLHGGFTGGLYGNFSFGCLYFYYINFCSIVTERLPCFIFNEFWGLWYTKWQSEVGIGWWIDGAKFIIVYGFVSSVFGVKMSLQVGVACWKDSFKWF